MSLTPTPPPPASHSLDQALQRTYLGIALFTAAIIAVSLLIMASWVLRGYAAQNLELVARSISYTVEAAVVFHDEPAAQEALASAAVEADVADIQVRYEDGRLVAEWQPSYHRRWFSAADGLSRLLLPAAAVVPIRHEGRVLGSVRIVADGHRLLRDMLIWLTAIGLCLALSSVGALYLARRMWREIEQPLQQLAHAARGARIRRELWRRVPPTRIVELRMLGDDFNGLMAELEAWEHHMRRENAWLSYQAQHDKLTGVFNRAHFERELDAHFRSAATVGEYFGLLFIDCDDFKRINDAYGHDMGDQALIHLAQLLRDGVRADDMVGRLGGDEFSVLLRSPYRLGDAAVLARRLMQACAQPMRAADGRWLPVSCSIGVAEYPVDGADVRQLMAKADARMYQCKRAQMPPSS